MAVAPLEIEFVAECFGAVELRARRAEELSHALQCEIAALRAEADVACAEAVRWRAFWEGFVFPLSSREASLRKQHAKDIATASMATLTASRQREDRLHRQLTEVKAELARCQQHLASASSRAPAADASCLASLLESRDARIAQLEETNRNLTVQLAGALQRR